MKNNTLKSTKIDNKEIEQKSSLSLESVLNAKHQKANEFLKKVKLSF
jgi:hypothetical protein